MSIITDKHGRVGKYVQRVRGDMVTFEPNEIIHAKDKVDMDNEVFGISKVETLCYDLLGDKEAAQVNYSFFKNDALPASLVMLENEMEETEIQIAVERLKQQFS